MIRTDARSDNAWTATCVLAATERTSGVTNRRIRLIEPAWHLIAPDVRFTPIAEPNGGADVSSGEGPGAPIYSLRREVVMKRIAVLVLLCLLALPVLAGDEEEAVLAGSKKAEALLLKKLGECGQEEMQRIAFLLGSRQVTAAVVPLMRMLHEGTTEKCRMVAALSLCLLGDERGTYAVRRAATFDPSRTVRIHCAWYYNEYVRAGSFAFIQQPDLPSNVASLER